MALPSERRNCLVRGTCLGHGIKRGIVQDFTLVLNMRHCTLGDLVDVAKTVFFQRKKLRPARWVSRHCLDLVLPEKIIRFPTPREGIYS